MKPPFKIGIDLIFRMFLPGLIISISLLPLFLPLFEIISNETVKITILTSVSAIFFGWLISLNDYHIFKTFEGRNWPSRMRKPFIKWQEKRFEKLKSGNDATVGNQDKIELAYKQKYYPLSPDGERFVEMPTLLGNVMYEYEGYPRAKYGMDSNHFYYRIWTVIDNDLKTQMQGMQSMADGAIYTSFSCFISSIIFFVYFLLDKTCAYKNFYMLIDGWVFFLGSVIFVFFGYLFYRSGVTSQHRFGEFYKALFDVMKDKVHVDDIVDFMVKETNLSYLLSVSPRQKNLAVSRFLDWHKVKRRLTGPNSNFEEVAKERVLNSISLEDIQGIGKQMSKKLNEENIYNVQQLANIDDEKIERISDNQRIGRKQLRGWSHAAKVISGE